MSSFTRLSLVAIVGFGVGALSGCQDNSVTAPRGEGGMQSPIQLPAGIDLTAQYVANHDYVVLTWALRRATSEPVDFLLERSADPGGPWEELLVTQRTNYGDNLIAEQRCYRVSAGADVSRALCVSLDKARY